MYDLIIIGSGPAGFSASIYASCYKIPHLVLGKVLGGQMSLATYVLNYPGVYGVTGKELTQKMVEQVRKMGGEIITESVVKVSKMQRSKDANSLENRDENLEENYFEIETESGKKYEAKSIILATGMERRKLNVPGEVEYTGKGVFYCAVCEREFYEGKTVGIVGGSNSALQAAVQLSDLAKRVYVIYRGTELRGDPVWIDQMKNNPKIEVVYQTVVTEIVGDGKWVTGVRLNSPISTNNTNTLPPQRDPASGGTINEKMSEFNNFTMLQLDDLFVEIGGVPGSALAISLGVNIDEKGLIQVNDDLSTNIPGVFAAGDLVGNKLSLEQIVTASALGARAASSAYIFLKGQKAPTVWGESQIKR